MQESPAESLPRVTHEFPWRDASLAVGVTVLAFVLSARFQFNEALYALTRRWEFLQLDELPTSLLAFSLCLTWLSLKRYRHAHRELQRRRIAETQLAGALAENRRLARETLHFQEIERKHLARELHDELGQYLNAIKLDAVSIGDGKNADPQCVADASQAIIRTVDHVYAAVGEMIGRLRPVGLDELGLVAAIEHCVDQWRQRLPQMRFELSIDGSLDGLSEPLTLTLYRLIQEGLTNIYKHADATRAEIAVERAGVGGGKDELRLTVADDGRGMESEARTTRFGLSGMRERVELSGGSFVLTNQPGHGLKFVISLPVKGEQ